jgi:hypothetical protein
MAITKRRLIFSAQNGFAVVKVTLSNSMKGVPSTPISIFLRSFTAVGPCLGPAFVERDFAIINTLLVLPFLTESFFASESRWPLRWRDCVHGLSGVGLAIRLSTEIDGSQCGSHQGYCERLIRQERHG